MNPFLVIGIPLLLIIVGMILNGLRIPLVEPETVTNQDPAKRLEAERDGYRKSMYQQRASSLKRQSRAGLYCWLLLIAFVASHLWMYFDTVKKATAWNQIAALRTLATEKGNEMALSVTRSDGTNEKYRIKVIQAAPSDDASADARSTQKLASWELSNAKTALSIGNKSMPLGVSLKITN